MATSKRELDRSTTWVYRAYINGRLAYVGITRNPRGRFSRHACTKDWWAEVDDITYEEFDNRADALRAETLAIHNEHPLHNIARPHPQEVTRG